MSNTYLFTYGGGFGDVILSYLMLETGYFKALKEREPDCKIRVAIMSHNPASRSLFEHHPLIDEILYKDWDNNPYDFFNQSFVGCNSIEVAGSSQCCITVRPAKHPGTSNLIYEQPLFYLTPEEQKIADDIVTGGKFVAFHPFGGHLPRSWQGKIDIKKTVDELCDAGIRVILLGGSSDRTIINTQRLTEQIDYERDGLVNLVNKHSIMLQSYVCSKAEKLVGAMSCFSCVTAAFNIPSLLVTIQEDEPRINLPITEHWSGVYNLFRKNEFQIYYFEKLPVNIIACIVNFCKEKHV